MIIDMFGRKDIYECGEKIRELILSNGIQLDKLNIYIDFNDMSTISGQVLLNVYRNNPIIRIKLRMNVPDKIDDDKYYINPLIHDFVKTCTEKYDRTKIVIDNNRCDKLSDVLQWDYISRNNFLNMLPDCDNSIIISNTNIDINLDNKKNIYLIKI